MGGRLLWQGVPSLHYFLTFYFFKVFFDVEEKRSKKYEVRNTKQSKQSKKEKIEKRKKRKNFGSSLG